MSRPFTFLVGGLRLPKIVKKLRQEGAQVILLADAESLLSLVHGGFSCHKGGVCSGIAPPGVVIDGDVPGGTKTGRELLHHLPKARVLILSDAELHPADIKMGLLRAPKEGADDHPFLTSWMRAIVVAEQVESAVRKACEPSQ